ncbi:MAG: hypothetical protein NTZ48_06970, partial [Candidatus Omnitrophica bacterium]|nr:hypothetical protein [Candidatus Omnitrophota bacterium]
MGRKVSILIRLACILIAGFFVSMPLSVSARRIMIPRYAVSEEEITALREEHSFLKYFPLEVVERRLLALKIFLNREDAGRVCAELLRYSSEDLEERARRLDAIEGLKVSYRNELSMLTVLPETVRDNLAILNAN